MNAGAKNLQQLLIAGSYPFLRQVSCGQGVLQYQLRKHETTFTPGSRSFLAVTLEDTLLEVGPQFRLPL